MNQNYFKNRKKDKYFHLRGAKNLVNGTKFFKTVGTKYSRMNQVKFVEDSL